MSRAFLHDPKKAQAWGQCSSVKVNVVFYVALITPKTWCGAGEVQKYSAIWLEFTDYDFLTFSFSVAKTITDWINTLKKLWNTWNPWRERSGNYLHPWFWHWIPDFQQKLMVRIWFGGFFVFCWGFFLFLFEKVDHQLRWDPHTECVPSASSENEWWAIEQRGRCSIGTLLMLSPTYEEFSFKENWGACFVGHGLLSLALWGDSGHLIIRVVFEMQVKNTMSIG